MIAQYVLKAVLERESVYESEEDKKDRQYLERQEKEEEEAVKRAAEEEKKKNKKEMEEGDGVDGKKHKKSNKKPKRRRQVAIESPTTPKKRTRKPTVKTEKDTREAPVAEPEQACPRLEFQDDENVLLFIEFRPKRRGLMVSVHVCGTVQSVFFLCCGFRIL